MKILCFLFGHKPREEWGGYECTRCQDYVRTWDDEEWTYAEQYGCFWWLIVPLKNRPRFVWPRCQHCGKRLWFCRYGGDGEFCSDECFTRWLPF